MLATFTFLCFQLLQIHSKICLSPWFSSVQGIYQRIKLTVYSYELMQKIIHYFAYTKISAVLFLNIVSTSVYKDI